MVTTIQASKNVDRQLREERRERIAVEQRKLDTAREAEANTKRAARLEVEKAQRVAAAVKVGSTAEFTVPDDTMVYRIRVTMTHEDVTARQAARTLVIALAHLLSAIESESLTAAYGDGIGPDRAKRLAVILDGDSGRLCTRFGVMTAEMKTTA